MGAEESAAASSNDDGEMCFPLHTSLLAEWKSEAVVNREVEVAQIISPGSVSTHFERHVQETSIKLDVGQYKDRSVRREGPRRPATPSAVHEQGSEDCNNTVAGLERRIPSKLHQLIRAGSGPFLRSTYAKVRGVLSLYSNFLPRNIIFYTRPTTANPAQPFIHRTTHRFSAVDSCKHTDSLTESRSIFQIT